MTRWTGFFASPEFIGLSNFRRLLRDGQFMTALGNNFIYTFVAGLVVMGLALMYTYILSGTRIKRAKFFSNLFYFPNMIAQAATAVLWVFVYNPNFGLLNGLLDLLGLDAMSQAWLGSRGTAIPSISFALIWRSMGFYLILLLAGVDKIPGTYYDAARVEGASDILIFFKVTIPLLWDVLVIAVSLWIINSLKFFELVWAMTKGGPAGQTHTMATYMYMMAFGDQQMARPQLGYGSSIAVALFVISILLVGIYRKAADRDAVQY